jgi:hypothetical protein
MTEIPSGSIEEIGPGVERTKHLPAHPLTEQQQRIVEATEMSGVLAPRMEKSHTYVEASKAKMKEMGRKASTTLEEMEATIKVLQQTGLKYRLTASGGIERRSFLARFFKLSPGRKYVKNMKAFIGKIVEKTEGQGPNARSIGVTLLTDIQKTPAYSKLSRRAKKDVDAAIEGARETMISPNAIDKSVQSQVQALRATIEELKHHQSPSPRTVLQCTIKVGALLRARPDLEEMFASEFREVVQNERLSPFLREEILQVFPELTPQKASSPTPDSMAPAARPMKHRVPKNPPPPPPLKP